MSQDNDSIDFDDEPISIEEPDKEPLTIEEPDEEPLTIEEPDEEPLIIEEPDEEPLTIAEESSGRAISHTAGIRGAGGEFSFSRPLQKTGQGATRCRIFRSKISVPAMESLEEHINEWLDSDDIDVKDVGHLIGTMHGKIDEDNMIVMVWY